MQSKLYEKQISFLILSVTYIYFAASFSPLLMKMGYDQEIFQYIGMLLKKGNAPYIDAFDHKPPVIFFLNYLGYILTPGSTWGIFIIINLLGFFSCLLLFKIAAKKLDFFQAIIVTCLFIGSFHCPYYLKEGNYTRQVTAYIAIIMIFLILNSKKSILTSVLLGSFLSLVFFTQQNEILGLGVLCLYYLFFQENSLKTAPKYLIAFLGGLLIPTVIIYSIIMKWGAWNDFIEQVFLFNISSYIPKESLLNRIFFTSKKFVNSLWLNKAIFGACCILCFNLLTRIAKLKFDRTLIILLVALIFQIIGSSISGRAYNHYYLMILPFLFIFLIYSFTSNTNSRFFKPFISMFLIICLFTQVYRNYPKNTANYELVDKIQNYVDPEFMKDGQFYSFHARYLRINFMYEIIAPTKWVYIHYLGEEDVDKITSSFDNQQTRYILYFNDFPKAYPEAYKTYLDSKYNIAFSHGEFLFYERKEEFITQ